MHFYGRAAAEAIFSGPIFRIFTARRDRPRADAWFRPVAEARRRVTASGSVGASLRTDRHCITEQPGGCERDGQRCGEGRCGGRWKEELAECGARALGWERPTGLIFRLFCALLRRAAAEENFSSECSRLFTSYPTMIIRIIF